jgi:hypothetical protein
MKLSVVAVAGLAALLCPLPAPAAQTTYHGTGSIARGQTFTISDVNGKVNVRNGPALDVRAVLTADRGNPSDVKILMENGSNGVTVCVRYPGDVREHCGDHGWSHSNNDNDTTVDFDVTVPKGVAVVASSVNGDVSVRADAHASAETVNGKVAVEADDVSRASTVNGSISVRAYHPTGDRLRVSAVNGSIEVTLPASIGLRVSASVLNGSIEAGDLAVHRPQYGPGASVDGTLGDGKLSLSLKTLNGNISLTRV